MGTTTVRLNDPAASVVTVPSTIGVEYITTTAVENGAKPLPRRIAVTYKKAPGAPRVMTALSDWNLAPAIPAGEFVFTPPPDAKQVAWKTGEK